MGARALNVSRDSRLAEREHVATPMGAVCMSHAEAAAYREALEERALLRSAGCLQAGESAGPSD